MNNNSGNDNSQNDYSPDQILQFPDSQYQHYQNIPLQNQHPYPKGPMMPQIQPNYMPKQAINHPHPSIYHNIPPNIPPNSIPCNPNQIYPPLHNFNPLIRPMDNQFTVKRHSVSYRPQPLNPGIYPIPMKTQHISQPMINQYLYNRAIHPMASQPIHLTKVPMGNISPIELKMPNKPTENRKHSLLYERANQCSLIYSAIRNRNVLSFLGLDSNNKHHFVNNIDKYKLYQHTLPYNEIKIDNLWKYIETWRGNMFELNHLMANDGHKVAISPNTLTLLCSIIEMRIIDILSELIKISKGGKVITIEHLRTCLQKNSLDIATSSARKIEKLHAKIAGHY